MSSLEYTPPAAQALQWVLRVAGPDCQVVSVSRLHGGITAAIDLVEIGDASSASAQRLVLRRWSANDGRDERLVARETASGTLADSPAWSTGRMRG